MTLGVGKGSSWNWVDIKGLKIWDVKKNVAGTFARFFRKPFWNGKTKTFQMYLRVRWRNCLLNCDSLCESISYKCKSNYFIWWVGYERTGYFKVWVLKYNMKLQLLLNFSYMFLFRPWFFVPSSDFSLKN